MIKTIQTTVDYPLPETPADFKPNDAESLYDWYTVAVCGRQKYRVRAHAIYTGFRKHQLQIYEPVGRLDLGFVYHPDKKRWYSLEKYDIDFYVRIDSNYETWDAWHYVVRTGLKKIQRTIRAVTHWLRQKWQRWFFPKPKDKFPSLFPVAMRVMATTVANDLVAVQPMAAPTGQLFYLDYAYPKPAGTQLTLDFPPEIRKPKVVQLELPFAFEYSDILVQWDRLKHQP